MALTEAVQDYLEKLYWFEEADIEPTQANLAAVAGRMGDLDTAVSRATRAVTLAPTNATARLQLGSLLLSAGKVEEASVELTKEVGDVGLECCSPRAASTHRSRARTGDGG